VIALPERVIGIGRNGRSAWPESASMRSLLPVLVPLVPAQELLPAVCLATANLLARIGACSDEIDRELREMQEVALTRTTSRRVLGSMTDFAWLADAHDRGTDLMEIALKLAEAPCRPIGMRSPRRVARELLEAGESRRRGRLSGSGLWIRRARHTNDRHMQADATIDKHGIRGRARKQPGAAGCR
jgi:hypothetical protein